MKHLCSVLFLAALVGCGGASKPIEAPQLEIGGFRTEEVKTEATQYSPAWNTIKVFGTVVARNVPKDSNVLVLFEVRNEADPGKDPRVVDVILRGGVGNFALSESEFAKMSPPPKYEWKVIGWTELKPAKVEVASK